MRRLPEYLNILHIEIVTFEIEVKNAAKPLCEMATRTLIQLHETHKLTKKQYKTLKQNVKLSVLLKVQYLIKLNISQCGNELNGVVL